MLVKLLPENITKNWDTISFAIKEALPPVAGEGPDKLNRILESLLSGALECWAMYDYSEEGVKIQAIGTTQLLHENISDVYNLLIYSLYSFRHIDEESWVDAYTTIKEYAKSLGCNSVISYTTNHHLMTVASELDAEIGIQLIKINI